VDQLLHPRFDEDAEAGADKLATGLPASPGAATGMVVFNADDAEQWTESGKDVILCRTETSPEDIGGMHAAKGILTSRGGMTSHAAVVARGMGKCCVAGAGDIVIRYGDKTLSVNGKTLKEGDWISLNGSTGVVYAGKIDTVEPKLTGPFATIMKLADKHRKLSVRTNADTPGDTATAVKFGAEGIGLCRTEHMFFEGNRIISMRKMILADSQEAREKALAELLPLQRDDFIGIFKALKGRPATIRLLDPPLHEFVPHDEAGQKEMADALNVPVQNIRDTVDSLAEFNPMLGHRGCRLGIAYPEITAMQARAIIEAAYAVRGAKAEIMIPLVGHVKELVHQKRLIEQVFENVKSEKKGKKPPVISIGTMIEVPRGAVTADEIAAEADFFSFGTNDLTQMGCGFSRDDAGKFLKQYVEQGIYESDPFQSLDQDGVGQLMEIAAEKGRGVRKDLKLGICGEHGGDPSSIDFCHRLGLNYVSCSPYRVPVARLSAAQAAIKREETTSKSKKTKKSRKGGKKATSRRKKSAKKSKKSSRKTTKKSKSKSKSKRSSSKKRSKKSSKKTSRR
ncbi:MAG: putative PEP-binding protein, partial [Planctomycetota bacterium]